MVRRVQPLLLPAIPAAPHGEAIGLDRRGDLVLAGERPVHGLDGQMQELGRTLRAG